MAIDREQKHREMAGRGKYQGLYRHLCGLRVQEWRTSFGEIESIIGFELPASARLHRPWWANQGNGNGHSQALAWDAAGWETAEVDMNAEVLTLRRKGDETSPRFNLDEVLPVHDPGGWPVGLSLRAERTCMTIGCILPHVRRYQRSRECPYAPCLGPLCCQSVDGAPLRRSRTCKNQPADLA